MPPKHITHRPVTIHGCSAVMSKRTIKHGAEVSDGATLSTCTTRHLWGGAEDGPDMEDHLADIDGGAAGYDAPALLPDVRLLLFTPGAPPPLPCNGCAQRLLLDSPRMETAAAHLFLATPTICSSPVPLVDCQLIRCSVCCKTRGFLLCYSKELLNTAWLM